MATTYDNETIDTIHRSDIHTAWTVSLVRVTTPGGSVSWQVKSSRGRGTPPVQTFSTKREAMAAFEANRPAVDPLPKPAAIVAGMAAAGIDITIYSADAYRRTPPVVPTGYRGILALAELRPDGWTVEQWLRAMAARER